MAAMLSALNQATDDNFIRRQTLPNNRTIDHYHGITSVSQLSPSASSTPFQLRLKTGKLTLPSIVQDPNVNIDNDEERLALLAALRAQAAPLPARLDLDTVNNRLLNLANEPTTEPHLYPLSEESTLDPPTPEDEVQFFRDEEVRFRQQMIESGCPPCHPPEYTFPYDTEERQPKEHPAAMFYIISTRNGHGWHPLSHQMNDWKEFQRFQQGTRDNLQKDSKRSPQERLQRYIFEGQRLLDRYKFSESAALIDWSIDLATQSRLQTWLEYQAREVLKHYAMEATARRNIKNAHGEADREWTRNYEERRIAAHSAMLDWVEEHRVALSAAELKEKEKERESMRGVFSDDNKINVTAVASAIASRRRSARIQSRAAAGVPAKTGPSTQKPARQQNGRPRGLPAKTRPQKQAAPKAPMHTRCGRRIRPPQRLGWT